MAAVGQATRGCLHVECRAWDSQVQELRLPRSGEKRRFGTVSNRQDRQRGRNLTDYLFMLDSRLKVRVARATLVFFFGGVLFGSRETERNPWASRRTLTPSRGMSWKGQQGSWGKSSAWGFGPGKGSKKGRKGKGKTPVTQEYYGYEAGEPEWEESNQGGGAEQHLYRIKNRYHVAHATLKTACDQEGSAFAKQHKTNDFAFLSGKSLRALLTRDNHQLLRRPGVGLSEAAGSLQAGADVLKNMMDLDITILQRLFEEEEVVAALRLLNTLDPSVERGTTDLQGAITTLSERLNGVDGVEEVTIKLTIMASRLYLFGMQLLPLLQGFSDPAWWAEAIPETGNKALSAWQASPQSKSKMSKALRQRRRSVVRTHGEKGGACRGHVRGEQEEVEEAKGRFHKQLGAQEEGQEKAEGEEAPKLFGQF